MLLSITIKLFLGIISILFFIRISGKGQLGQVTPLDSLNTYVLGAFIGGTVYSSSVNVLYMLYTFIIWILLNQMIRLLSKTTFFNNLIYGKAEYLIKDGRVNLATLKRNNLNITHLKTILREKNIFSFLDANDVVFEPNGHLTIFKKQRQNKSYILVNQGQVDDNELKNSSLSKKELEEKIESLGYNNFEDLYCIEWTENRGYYIIDNDGKVSY